jgi:hypothetical protein
LWEAVSKTASQYQEFLQEVSIMRKVSERLVLYMLSWQVHG